MHCPKTKAELKTIKVNAEEPIRALLARQVAECKAELNSKFSELFESVLFEIEKAMYQFEPYMAESVASFTSIYLTHDLMNRSAVQINLPRSYLLPAHMGRTYGGAQLIAFYEAYEIVKKYDTEYQETHAQIGELQETIGKVWETARSVNNFIELWPQGESFVSPHAKQKIAAKNVKQARPLPDDVDLQQLNTNLAIAKMVVG